SMTDLHNVGQFDATPDADIDAPEAWDMNTGSTNVVVGIIDSGIDVTHSDLYLNIWLNQGEIPDGLKAHLIDTDGDGRITFYDLNDPANVSLVADKNGNGYIDAGDLLKDPRWADGHDGDKNGFVDDFCGWNFRTASDEPFAPNDPRDVLGHGTHVAGTIGAIGNNDRGVTGINWRSSLMALKFLDGSNQGLTSDAVLAVHYATMMRAEHGENVRVLNASWGQSGGASAALRTAIESSGKAGILFVAAAGNGNILGQGIDIDREPFYPASYDLNNVITVAATGAKDDLARFSNFGSSSVDLAAPGIGILSTLPGGRFGTANGTSMAAPHVTGVAALVWAEIPGATAAEVRQAILGGVQPLAELHGSVATDGRLNARQALDSDVFAPYGMVVNAPNITTAGGSENLITVRYHDRKGIDETSVGDGDVLLSRQWGPKDQLATTLVLGSLRVASDGTEVTAVYRVSAPGGAWDALDYGRYVVSVAAGQVSNRHGLTVPAGPIGEFSVRIAGSSVFYVDTLDDAVDADVGDGVCAVASGFCTLRAAIQESNAAWPAARTVILDRGTFKLSIPAVADPSVVFPTPAVCVADGRTRTWSNAGTGDLDITGNITLVGDEVATSIVDAAGIDRVFRVYPQATLDLRRIRVTGGRVSDVGGGGILTMGTLQLDHAAVAGNSADGVSGFGGGVAVWGGATDVVDTTIADNSSTSGGGLFVGSQASANIVRSTVMTNTATSAGGGVYAFGGTVEVTNSTLSTNAAKSSGGAADASAKEGSTALASVSADGRFVAFASYSALVPGDTNGLEDVFVFDCWNRTLERVSLGSDGSQGNSYSFFPSLNADGRFVAFTSYASNLVPGDTNGHADVFVYDRQNRTVERVNLAADGTQGNADSGYNDSVTLSADGRLVAFDSDATNLVPGDTNGQSDIFVFDRQMRAIERESVAANGTQGNYASWSPSLSADGRFVAFDSAASNLVPGDTNGSYDVFVFDRQNLTTERVSVAANGVQGNGGSSSPSLSADGRFVAFDSAASNLVAGDTNGLVDVFVFDCQNRTLERVDLAADGTQDNDQSRSPALSGDGRFVAFESSASNLVPGDTNGASDVFLFDRQNGTPERVSIATGGTQGSGAAYRASLSADGRFIAFDSAASNLVPGDTNGQLDVFVFDRQNRTLERNSAGFQSSSIVLQSTTVAENRTTSGAAVAGSVWTHNSLFVDNVRTSTGMPLDLSSGVQSLGYNLLEAADSFTAQTGDRIDPDTPKLIGPLQANGGPTWTHALCPGSPAVDAGDPAAYSNTDQRGISRPQDGDGQFGARTDLGAVESFAGSIQGVVFVDLNKNGKRDADEPGLSGKLVYLDTDADGQYDPGEPSTLTRRDDPATTTVQEEGQYSLDGVGPGTYRVVPQVEAGWVSTIAGVERASLAYNGAQANYDISRPSLSDDGQFVAFTSSASNLVSGDTNNAQDVFVFDRQNRTLERVSTAADGTQGNSASGYNDAASLSADGRFVAFMSTASNLVPGDTNGQWDVFVFDRQNRTLERVSLASDGTQGNGYSQSASLSADGRYVAFVSGASNLVPGDTNGGSDVFVFDRQNHALERVSLASDGTQGNGYSYSASLSDDGRFVAFWSGASNLVLGDTNGQPDVFVFDRQNRTLERVSLGSDGAQGNSSSTYPSLSADGRFVVFMSYASNLVPGDTNNCEDVFVFDRQSRTLERVSSATDGTQGNGNSGSNDSLSLSAEGRFVTFMSTASNLVPGDTNGAYDVFVFDRQGNRLERVSVGADGAQGNAYSSSPSLSADGRCVTFVSGASNLVAGDTNGASDVFVAPNRNADGTGTRAVGLFAGQVLANVDFGLVPNPGEIRGRCFDDVIANGVYDVGEPGRAGSIVYLDVNGNGRLDSGEPATQTTADGSYVFSQLPSYQEYHVRLVVPAGFTLVLPTTDDQGAWNVFLPAGGSIKDRDFGLRPVATTGQFEDAVVVGRVFADRDGDGLQDDGERGVAAVTVFLDLDNDGVRDFNEPQMLSASDDPRTPAVDETGQYEFAGLGNRPYTVRVLDVPNYLQVAPLGNAFTKHSYSLATTGNLLGSPQDVALADFNGDGAKDLATAMDDRNSIALLLNDGSGGFPQTPVEIPLAPAGRPPAEPRGFGPIALLAADFNRDGRPDLAVVNNTSSNVTILLDFNGISFASETYVPVGILPNAISSGDLDGDGDLDVVVTNEFGNSVSILRNDGQGHFTPDAATPGVGNHPFGIDTGDFNHDGRLDLVVADFGTHPSGGDLGDVRVLLANASGGFTSHVACPVGFGPATLVAKDLDGDGNLDLAVANFLSDNVTVCRGRGDGTFTVVATLPGGSGPMDIKAADLEGDGDLDLLVTNGKSQKVGILRSRVSQGAFEFEPAESFGVANIPGASQISLAVGDLDGNGTVDLALANSQDNSVAVHLNTLVGGAYRVALTGTETVTGLDFGLQPLDTTFKISSFQATSNGFVARFNRDLTASVLNLYDQGGVLGPADVTVVGATVGEVCGSLVVDPGLRTVTFIKTGGVLDPDTYTVTLVSGANAFRDTAGNLLDGNGDGTAGDAYQTNVTVTAPAVNSIRVSLPDFARG
ncbi:MAG: S8 family serine peptidase, partial [Planctomycetota bacterium]|nr:S8 family serine peptidase [Planctomycetota bacterium]